MGADSELRCPGIHSVHISWATRSQTAAQWRDVCSRAAARSVPGANSITSPVAVSRARLISKWFKSSRSRDGGECVEVAHLTAGAVGVRDSKTPPGQHSSSRPTSGMPLPVAYRTADSKPLHSEQGGNSQDPRTGVRGERGVSADLPTAEWFKSSHSGTGQDCVEIAYLAKGTVGVRDSEDPTGPALLPLRPGRMGRLHHGPSGRQVPATGVAAWVSSSRSPSTAQDNAVIGST